MQVFFHHWDLIHLQEQILDLQLSQTQVCLRLLKLHSNLNIDNIH